MKIPSSSSFFLATLAVSSSSGCLAAPAGTMQSQDTNTSQVSCAPQGSGTPSHFGSGHDDKFDFKGSNSMLHNRAVDTDKNAAFVQSLGILSGIPILGPILQGLLPPPLNSLSVDDDDDGSDTSADISPQDQAALQSAADEVSRILISSGMAGTVNGVGNTVGNIIGGIPAVGTPIAGVVGTVGGVVGGVANGAPVVGGSAGLPVPTGAVGSLPVVGGIVGGLPVGKSDGSEAANASAMSSTYSPSASATASSSTTTPSASGGPPVPPNTPALPGILPIKA